MARLYPTRVRIAGTLTSTEAITRLVRAIARERLVSNGTQISTFSEAAKAIADAANAGKVLELASPGARQGWHEHLEGACREYDISFEVKAFEEQGLTRHVAYVGHVGYLDKKDAWSDSNPHLKVMPFPRTSLRDMVSGYYSFD